jgi:hypothetical protein
MAFSTSTAVVMIGIAGTIFGGIINARAIGRLLLALKQHDMTTFIRLGASSGASPPDPKFGTRELQRYIYSAEYRQSAHEDVRVHGHRARVGILVSLACILVLIVLMLVHALRAI